MDIKPPPKPCMRRAMRVHKKERYRNDPGQQIRGQRAFHFARVGDAIFLQLVGKLRVYPRGHELAFPVRERLLELALNVAIRDRNFSDLAIVQELLELTVGDRRDR
jgi:hypothetical protein